MTRCQCCAAHPGLGLTVPCHDDGGTTADSPSPATTAAGPCVAAEMTIVLARVYHDTVVDGPYRADLGETPRLKQIPAASAMVWLSHGTDVDAAKARSFADGDGWQVFVYPTTEQNPLGRAKADAMRIYSENRP